MDQEDRGPIKTWLLIGLVGIGGFVGGQVAPTYTPAEWSVGYKDLDFQELNETYEVLQRKFDGNIDESKVMDGARAGVVSSAGDPYTQYLDAKAAKELEDQLTGTLSGIGAEVGIRNNKLTVVAPISGSPAEKAGLTSGDYIARINDEDTTQYTLDEAVAKIRGDKGTKVKLLILRGSNEPKELEITREIITVTSVKWSMKENNIGYINITSYGTDTTEKTAQAATELKNQGAQKIVLDLRNNPGGYLDAAVNVTSQFIPAGKTVVEERHEGKTQKKLTAQGGGTLVGLPVVVLINQGSASASEITAGAMRDEIGAKIIGEKSFGKGSVQEIVKLPSGGQMKVTVARWYTPKGTSIDKQGIKPTIEVKQTSEDVSAGRDPQLDRALAELR